MLKNVYTVKQVNAYIKNMFTQDFMLNRLYVKGEVSNCSRWLFSARSVSMRGLADTRCMPERSFWTEQESCT